MTVEADVPAPAVPPGRRERKKAETRRSISDVATRLFIERGFDAVTLAEVAEAADVSVKTIFNHFGSKEELFLDRGEELRAALVLSVAGRPEGRTVSEALHAALADSRLPGEAGWNRAADARSRELLRRFFATWSASSSLQGRHLMWNERLREELSKAIAGERGLDAGEPRVQAMAAMLVAAVQLRHNAFTGAILADEPLDEVERRVRAVAAEALVRVARAFPDLDLPPP
jgi:AcrR family transcriptional regulator